MTWIVVPSRSVLRHRQHSTKDFGSSSSWAQSQDPPYASHSPDQCEVGVDVAVEHDSRSIF